MIESLARDGQMRYGDHMKKIRMKELGEPFQRAVNEAAGESLVIEDEQGEERYSVCRLGRPSAEQKRRALASLEKLWDTTGRSTMEEAGVSEDDLMGELPQDD